MTEEYVGRLDELPEGQVRVFDCANGRSVAISNLGGELFAIDNVCTHDGGPLGEGYLRRDRVICPRHGAAFDARTGKVLSLPAVKNVSAYPVRVDGEMVYVDSAGAGGAG